MPILITIVLILFALFLTPQSRGRVEQFWDRFFHRECTRSYYASGRTQTYVCLKDKLREGTYKEWDENGNLRVQAYYEAGQLHGVYEVYSPEGMVQERALFEHGTQKSYWRVGMAAPISQ